MTINPYESPSNISAIPPPRRWSLLRGLAYAVPLGMLGICVPAVGIVCLKIVDAAGMEWQDLPGELAHPCFDCAIVFFFSALANYTPKTGIGFIRSIMILGILAIVAVFIAVLIFPVESYEDPHEWMRFAAFYAMISVSGLALTCWQIQRNPKPSQSSDSNQ